MTSASKETDSPIRQVRLLTRFDCICIIVGTIIGAGIFKMPAVVAGVVPNVYALAGVWVCGGLIALVGALCFAELTTTYPDRGGDYGYLKRAYHGRVGFAFAWTAFWVIRPGNIGALAMIFGQFAIQFLPDSMNPQSRLPDRLSPMALLAALVVVVITLTNLLGVRFGKTTQNVLTVAKVAGILLVIIAAFSFWPNQQSNLQTTNASSPDATPTANSDPAADDAAVTSSVATEDPQESEDDSTFGWFWLALVFVMFTFGGWNDIAFVASEVREPKQNLLPSLVVGTVIVLLIYLLVNFALVYGMGFERMASLGQQWQSATSALIGDHMGVVGNRLFAGLVCVSCLGAINAMVFTSPRIYWATAADYPALRWASGSNAGGDGWRAMLLQAIVTLVFIGMFGAQADGFDNIVAATAPYFWIFLALTVISLVVCRIRFKGKFDGYRVPFGPLLPFVFVAACGFMTYRGFLFMFEKSERIQPAILIGMWVLLGVVLSFVLKSHSPTEE